MASLQDLINQLLPQLLAQPRSRADLLTEAERLYNPKYQELTSETTGDYGQTRSRSLEDFGTEEQLLARQRQQAALSQGQQNVMLKERLATQGLNAEGGLGDIQRNALANDQQQQNLGLADAAQSLAKRRTRTLADIERDQFRSLRGIGRDRASAIEGYVTDPRFVFPYA